MDLNAQAVHITESFANAGQYASFDSVLQNLLTWHGAPTFAHLPPELLYEKGRVLTTAQELPVLDYLWRIDKHVKTFVDASLGASDVLTYPDLERDVVGYLRGFLVPHLSAFKNERANGQVGAGPNPEEIDIDEIDDVNELEELGPTENERDTYNFNNAFGVGPLGGHRSILHHFHSMGQKNLTQAEIFKHLSCFLEHSSDAFGTSAADVPLAEFGAFVADAEGVSHYTELGFVLRPQANGRGLATECQVLRHVQRKRMLRQAAAAENILSQGDSTKGDTSASQVPLRKRPRHESSLSTFKWPTPVMAQPSRPKLEHFLDLCKGPIRDSTYSPSFTKMNEIVRSLVEENHLVTKAAPAKGKFKDNTAAMKVKSDSLIEVATDWAMLHLGGGKYRRRSIQVECNETAASKDEDEKSEDSSDEDQSYKSESLAVNIKESIKVGSKPTSDLPTLVKQNQPSLGKITAKLCANEGAGGEEEEEVPRDKVKQGVSLQTGHRGWVITLSPSQLIPGEPAQLGDNRSVGPGEALDIYRPCLPWGLPALDRSDGYAVGRWGEAFVNQLLLQKYPPATGAIVEWVNEKEETRAAYDLKVTFTGPHAHSTWGDPPVHPRRSETVFIEVKTTASDRLSTFELSLQEWDFATRRVGSSLVTYHVYRVYGAGNPSRVRVQVIEDILRSIEAKRVRLCLSV
jgi:hypothetical protein